LCLRSAAGSSLPFDRAQAESHLRFLHDGLTGFADLRTLPPIDSAVRWPCANIDEALEIAERATLRERNVYVGVATRRTGGRGEREGGAQNLVAARCLWVDFDFGSDWLDQGAREEFDIKLELLGLEPSLMIWTGGGVHAYFRLARPFDLSSPERVAPFEHTLKGLAAQIGGDRAATDAARILRLAGTINFPSAEKRARGRETATCRVRGCAA
jgi:hypothetical protein